MTSLQDTKPAQPPATRASASAAAPASPAIGSCCSTASFPPDTVRSWLGSRRVLAIAGLALGGGGIAFGWDWLVAVGIAPLLVSAAPCLVMCALGLCIMGKNHQAGSSQTAREATQAAKVPDPGEAR